MCKHGTDTLVGVIRRNNDNFPDGWHYKPVDSCIAGTVQLMNLQGIITVGCCCGHAEYNGDIFVASESADKLTQHGYQWIWPKDGPDDDREWWRSRTDIVIVKLPLLEKTWTD